MREREREIVVGKKCINLSHAVLLTVLCLFAQAKE